MAGCWRRRFAASARKNRSARSTWTDAIPDFLRIVLRIGAGAALAALVAACSGTPQRAPGKVSVADEALFYDVVGSSAEELYVQMRAKGVRKSRATFFGEYRWDLNWNYQYKAGWTGACRVTAVQVKLKTQTILPRWQPPPDADALLRLQWTRFVSALERHEQGHAQLAARAAEEVKSALQGVSAPDCTAIRGAAEKLAQDIVKRQRDADEKYDRDTRHGVSQGAIWPPVVTAKTGRKSYLD